MQDFAKAILTPTVTVFNRHCRDRQKTQAVIDDIYAKDPGCRFILLR